MLWANDKQGDGVENNTVVKNNTSTTVFPLDDAFPESTYYLPFFSQFCFSKAGTEIMYILYDTT